MHRLPLRWHGLLIMEHSLLASIVGRHATKTRFFIALYAQLESAKFGNEIVFTANNLAAQQFDTENSNRIVVPQVDRPDSCQRRQRLHNSFHRNIHGLGDAAAELAGFDNGGFGRKHLRRGGIWV